MLRRRSRRSATRDESTLPVGPQRIDSGTAELVRDPDRPSGWMLLVNGMESSHADLEDPAWLEFEYLRWMASVIEHGFPAGTTPEVLHLGAAGCSLARHLLVTRPGSRHLGVDIDARLTELVREWFRLPRAPELRIRIGDAREVLTALPDAGRDVIVRDVFAGQVTPRPLLTEQFVHQVRRVLRPGGLYLANCADFPNLQLSRLDAATLRTRFAHVSVVADPPMLKGRRRGNVVLIASDTPIGTAGLLRELRSGAVPADLWDDARVRSFTGNTAPVQDPAPPTAPSPSLDATPQI